MSESSAQIFAEASKLPMVVNPGHSPTSTNPADTTRSPEAIEADFETMEGIIARYRDALMAETNNKWPPLDANPYWSLRYKLAHYGTEHRFAVEKGNQ